MSHIGVDEHLSKHINNSDSEREEMSRRSSPTMLGLALLCVVLTGAPAATAATPDTVNGNELVSVQTDGDAPEHQESEESAVSADGRYVVFTSRAKQLVQGAGSTRGNWHIYLRDRETATTAAIDVRPNGRFGNDTADHYYRPSISADGRLVVFVSQSTNLVPGGYGKHSDVFVRDVDAATTEVVSVAAGGGRANSDSSRPAISADGTTIVFSSYASNLVAAKPPYKTNHIYRRDLASGETSLISRTPTGDFPDGGSYSPSLSADGALIAYDTSATDIAPGGHPDVKDVIVFNADTQKSTLLRGQSRAEPPNGDSNTPFVSADGTAIVYASYASNLVEGDANDTYDIFRFTTATGLLSLVTHSDTGGSTNSSAYAPAVDAVGDRVVFESDATNIVPGDDNSTSDIFVVDLSTGLTTLVSRDLGGSAANGESVNAFISGNGLVVVYASIADDIVSGTRQQISRSFAYSFS